MGQHTVIHLTSEQRQHLENLIHAGAAPARTQTKARILLLSDRSQGQRRTDDEIAQALLCSKGTIGSTRKRFVAGGFEAALYDRCPSPKLGLRGNSCDLHLECVVTECVVTCQQQSIRRAWQRPSTAPRRMAS